MLQWTTSWRRIVSTPALDLKAFFWCTAAVTAAALAAVALFVPFGYIGAAALWVKRASALTCLDLKWPLCTPGAHTCPR